MPEIPNPFSRYQLEPWTDPGKPGDRIDAYQVRATATAIYPGQGTGMGLAYAALGLNGEVSSEVAEHIVDAFHLWGVGWDPTPLRKELGDVLWYAAQVATEIGAPLSECARADTWAELDAAAVGRSGEWDALSYNAHHLSRAAGTVAEHAKKILRDHGGRLEAKHVAGIGLALCSALERAAALANFAGTTLQDCAAVNLAKLADRAARGVLHGSGDNR